MWKPEFIDFALVDSDYASSHNTDLLYERLNASFASHSVLLPPAKLYISSSTRRSSTGKYVRPLAAISISGCTDSII
jgi:hypothetical protein